jgi:hypothetical protein
MANPAIEQAEGARAKLGKLSTVSWGLFFVWIGVTFLFGIGWGTALIGIGVIALGGAAVRLFLQLPIDWFWLLFGIAFVAWGLCESLNIKFSGALLPILSIAAGLAMLVGGLLPRSRH